MKRQFLRFCVVGVAGFGIDTGILQALVTDAHADPYLARAVSFLAAASATWLMNRHYTFEVDGRASRAEWARYVTFMVAGALVNYGAFAGCIDWWEQARAHLWMGVAVGSIAGLGVNFMTSRLLVFRASA